MPKMRICILFCGGTIVMSKDKKTGSLDVKQGTEAILNLEPKLIELYDFDLIYIDNIDSSNMTPNHWDKIIDIIEKRYYKFDGFVITHGTNTLGYTSAALSFALNGIGKPVVLTGAQIPADQLESDARRNFVNAVKLASMDIAGVYVVFGSKIILGTRAKKDNEYSIDAFKSFNQSDVGTIGIDIKMQASYKKRHNIKWKAKKGFSAKIMVLTLEPGLTAKELDTILKSGIEGLIIRAYGAGDIPYSLIPSLTKAKMPIVVTTQCPNGVTRMGLNDVGGKALDTGVIQAFDMSMESMTTKLKWLLTQQLSLKKIKQLMETDLAGEIVPQER